MNLFGTYMGQVEAVDDPEKRGRVKVRVVMAYGPTSGLIGTEDLPWALPAGLPAGGSPDSGGLNWLPAAGDQVFVRFLDGQPEKPIWEWASQTSNQRTHFGFRRYEGRNPKPEVLLTRFGHAIEMSPEAIVTTTRSGYSVLLQDGMALDGLVELRTGRGNFLRFEDLVNTLFLFVPEVMKNFDNQVSQGNTETHVMRGLFHADGGKLAQLVGAKVQLGGITAADPVVRRSDLQAAINAIKLRFDAHIHPTPKGPSGPPTVKLTVTAQGSRITFST